MINPAVINSPFRVKVAILSDLHLELDTSWRGRCTVCKTVMVIRNRKDMAACACGECWVGLESAEIEVLGPVEALPPREPSWGNQVRQAGADLVLLLGDIHRWDKVVEWAAREFPGLPVFIAPGNHEPYRADLVEAVLAMRAAAHGTNVTVLDRDVAVLSIRSCPVRVLGATMWTDYRLLEPDVSQVAAMVHAGRSLEDHYAISSGKRPFMPGDALTRHEGDMAWLESELARPFAGLTLIMTRHPFLRCADPSGNANSPAFSSAREDVVERFQPDLVA